ncbi:polysaccharide deacetylase family protein [Peribacillus glennii]|uniref:Polysaccharide deacetylase family protein n=1 Tax=Peribacillus glennii TaxID=2303991 RepID=A0A372LB89_9BACI|nr:polysaccharide deacetylase family protein [Peribacillus glennii]RFU62123.1 polysaccharide deacetylase family protein [Peribacillus glennii]
MKTKTGSFIERILLIALATYLTLSLIPESSLRSEKHVNKSILASTASNRTIAKASILQSNADLQRKIPSKIPILMYHAIADYEGNGLKGLYVTPKIFRSQIQYLTASGFTPITFDDLARLKKLKKPIIITFDDGYKNNINAFAILKELRDSKFNSKGVIFMIANKVGTKNGLSPRQLKTISDSGIMSIQSHTYSHPSLTTTKNYKKELVDSKRILETITGKKINTLCYPIGHYNSTVISETKKYYDYAVTTKPGFADLKNRYELNRIRVSYDTSLTQFKKLVKQ